MKKSPPLSKRVKSFLTIFLLLTLSFIFSCNNDKKAEQSETMKEEFKDTVSSNKVATNDTDTFNCREFSILKLEKDSLIKLFPNGNAQKLLIEFSMMDTLNSTITAIAYSAQRGTGVVVEGPTDLNPANDQTWDTSGKLILGNNELTLPQIKKLIGGNVSSNAKDLYFYPRIKNNMIYYYVSTELTTQKDKKNVILILPPGGDDTKPSPPSPPY